MTLNSLEWKFLKALDFRDDGQYVGAGMIAHCWK